MRNKMTQEDEEIFPARLIVTFSASYGLRRAYPIRLAFICKHYRIIFKYYTFILQKGIKSDFEGDRERERERNRDKRIKGRRIVEFGPGKVGDKLIVCLLATAMTIPVQVEYPGSLVPAVIIVI
jgi:hypothetical protein